MIRKIEKCSIAIENKLSIILNSNEYHVASQILHRMAANKKDRIMIFRDSLAYYCNMSARNISRITDKLHEKGIIEKQLIGDSEKKKTFNFYKINWEKLEEILSKIDEESEETDENSAQNVRLNESMNLRNKETLNLGNYEDKELEEAESANTEILW